MRFTSFVARLTLVASGLSLALPGFTNTEASQPIVDQLALVNTGIKTLDSAAQGLSASSSVEDVSGVVALTQNVRQQVAASHKAVSVLPSNPLDLLPIKVIGSAIAQSAHISADNLIEKKDIIVQANQKDALLEQLNGIKVEVSTLSNTMGAGLPAALADFATADARSSIEAVQKIINRLS
jgi:hypothetical protein